jgi:hypothetical protein
LASIQIPTYTALSFGVDLTSEAVLRLAKEARVCAQSPRAPDESGWGVPNWRDAGAYPIPDELDELEWRWEFLRRRHGYRLDWLRPGTDFHPATRERYFLDVYDLEMPFDPRLSVRDLAAGVSRRARRGTPDVFLFPVSGLVPFRRALLSRLFATLDEIERIVPVSPTVDDIFVRFDLGQPIRSQLEQIGCLLEKLRAEAYGDEDATRMRRQLWPTYLRLLDAKDAGASLGEMTTILPATCEHTPQQVRTQLQAAERLRRDWRYGSRRKG